MPTLSERLKSFAGRLLSAKGGEPTDQDVEDLCEAARLLAPYEQPEVWRLLERARDLFQRYGPDEQYGKDLMGYAAALVALAEAQETLLQRKTEEGDHADAE